MRWGWPVVVLLTACGTQMPPASLVPQATVPPPPTGAESAPDPWPATAADDLDLLLSQIETVHPEPFHGVPRSTFVSALEDLKRRVDQLTPEAAMVQLMRTTALLSQEGRDGHQFVLPVDSAEPPTLPLRVYEFPDGVFVTAAYPPHQDLAGARIVAINDHPIDEVLDAIEPMVPRDGPATVQGFRPFFMLRTVVLEGLGFIGEGRVPITVEADGQQRTVDVEPLPFDTFSGWSEGNMVGLPARPQPIFLSSDDIFWTLPMPEARALYVRFGSVQPVPLEELDALALALDDPAVERLVIDLRHNGGGDNGTYGRLLRTIQRAVAARPLDLVVITDRLTFSAASNFATELEQSTDAIFVGEPMGGGLNFWSDTQDVYLLNWPIPSSFAVSARYWQFSIEDDPRLTIEPHLPVAYTAADYFGGRDPVLDAALGALP